MYSILIFPAVYLAKGLKSSGLLKDLSCNNTLFIFYLPKPPSLCLNSMHHLTKGTVAILQLITCSVTEFWCQKEISSGIKREEKAFVCMQIN